MSTASDGVRCRHSRRQWPVEVVTLPVSSARRRWTLPAATAATTASSRRPSNHWRAARPVPVPSSQRPPPPSSSSSRRRPTPSLCPSRRLQRSAARLTFNRQGRYANYRLCSWENYKFAIHRLQRILFGRKTDEMTKTGHRDENIDFWRNLTKLRNSGFVPKFLTKFAFLTNEKWHLAAKSGGDLEKALSHKFNHVTRFQAKRATVHCLGYPICSSLVFFLEKSRSQKPQTVLARLHRIS